MAKNTHNDTIDCLLAELKDVYRRLREVPEASTPGAVLDLVYDAEESLERAYQLVSDLKAKSD